MQTFSDVKRELVARSKQGPGDAQASHASYVAALESFAEETLESLRKVLAHGIDGTEGNKETAQGHDADAGTGEASNIIDISGSKAGTIHSA